jgi:hypothetical protein
MVFAKRKRTPFKGPMLSLAVDGSSVRSRSREGSTGSGGGRRSASLTRGRGAGIVIAEEDEEDEMAEDEIEEVDAFSPIDRDGGETAEMVEGGDVDVIQEGDEEEEGRGEGEAKDEVKGKK